MPTKHNFEEDSFADNLDDEEGLAELELGDDDEPGI